MATLSAEPRFTRGTELGVRRPNGAAFLVALVARRDWRSGRPLCRPPNLESLQGSDTAPLAVMAP